MGRFFIILAVDFIVVGALVVWAVQRPGALSGASLAVAAACGIGILLAAVFRLLWNPMLVSFPPREPAPDAVHRSFQSFGLGIVNMGLSIHAAVDDEYLHLRPLRVLQLLGAHGASIPWSAMEPVGTSGRVVRVAGHRLDGPRWCISLASPRDATN